MSKTEAKTEVVNPFNTGVTYEQFTKALGTKSVKEYLTPLGLTQNEVEWIESEITHYKNNK